jgi:hypothetical protein
MIGCKEEPAHWIAPQKYPGAFPIDNFAQQHGSQDRGSIINCFKLTRINCVCFVSFSSPVFDHDCKTVALYVHPFFGASAAQ